MWLLIIHSILTIWVVFDSIKRRSSFIPWAIGTLAFGPILLPVYIARRPQISGETEMNRRLYNLLKRVSILWTILLVLVCIWSQKQDINSAVQNDTLEYRLAVINNKSCMERSDATVSRFSSLLDRLTQKCKENREQIINISVIAHDRIVATGVKESLLEVMEDLNRLMDKAGPKKQKYTDYIYTYARLRNSGLSHDETIERLEAAMIGFTAN